MAGVDAPGYRAGRTSVLIEKVTCKLNHLKGNADWKQAESKKKKK